MSALNSGFINKTCWRIMSADWWQKSSKICTHG